LVFYTPVASSFVSVAKKLSATALSQQWHLRLTLFKVAAGFQPHTRLA
jgi:hypothetical protein